MTSSLVSRWDVIEMLNGGVASSIATVFTNPLDLLKTRLQVQGEGGQSNKYGNTPFSALKTIVKEDGWAALQHGVSAAVTYNFIINSVRLGFFAYCDNKGYMKDAQGETHLPMVLVCSSTGGALGAVASNPFYLLKTQMQTQSSTGVGEQHTHNGLRDGMRSIYKSRGLAGFYQGTYALMMRNLSLSSAQLVSFAAIKDTIEDLALLPANSMWVSFVGGVLSGFVVIGVGTPFDVTSVRLSNQSVDHRGRGKMYKSYSDCFVKVLKHEGIRGLYKGAIPAYVRKGPHNLIQLFIWDYLRVVSRKIFPDESP